MRGQGLLDHAPVPQVEVVPIREDLGMWGSSSFARTGFPDRAPAGQGPAPLLASSPNQVATWRL